MLKPEVDFYHPGEKQRHSRTRFMVFNQVNTSSLFAPIAYLVSHAQGFENSKCTVYCVFGCIPSPQSLGGRRPQ